jgi:hypothetical protein
MNVVNTRTNILIFMVVTQEPTIGKCQLLLETKIWEKNMGKFIITAREK